MNGLQNEKKLEAHWLQLLNDGYWPGNKQLLGLMQSNAHKVSLESRTESLTESTWHRHWLGVTARAKWVTPHSGVESTPAVLCLISVIKRSCLSQLIGVKQEMPWQAEWRESIILVRRENRFFNSCEFIKTFRYELLRKCSIIRSEWETKSQTTYRSYSPEATGPAMGVGELECIGMRSFTIGSEK